MKAAPKEYEEVKRGAPGIVAGRGIQILNKQEDRSEASFLHQSRNSENSLPASHRNYPKEGAFLDDQSSIHQQQ
jgi:hypothetical protein